jgi:hypothetical protein
MKKLSSSIRESAIDIYRGNKKIEDDTMRKFFYYIEAYCVETKSTEDDILFNDKKWNSVFELFNNVMLDPISCEN